MTPTVAVPPVRSTIVVNAPPARAFEVFTTGIDRWWPRSHHIGKTDMKATVVEPKLGGRCYSTHVDGSEVTWGTVRAWEPPRRLVLAWQITPTYQCETDPAKASEVEVRFVPEGGGTRVELEHRHFERHGEGGAAMAASVGAPNGWTGLLGLFKTAVG
ncbi:MAG: SRPBCC domain-containing protein [Gemmatimonadetes bacterium]|nr:SRPBCC domain-containing protein [Gemmatimonadota bacterium]